MNDFGADPLGDGTYKMVPSGDIVDLSERNRRLPIGIKPGCECLGLSWDEIERKQGGKLKRNA